MQNLNAIFAKHKVLYSLIIVIVVVTLTSIGVYAYLVNNKEVDNDKNDEPIIQASSTPIATQIISPTEKPQYVSCTEGKNKFVLKPNGKPVLVKDQPQLVEFIDKITEEQNFDKLSQHYLMGEFEGEINGKTYDTQYYGGIYKIKQVEVEFPTSEMVYIVRYIIDKDNIIIFDNGKILEVSKQTETDYKSMGVNYIKYVKQKNVIDVTDDDRDCVIQSIPMQENGEIQTENNVNLYIYLWRNNIYNQEELADMEMVDSYNDMDVYINDDEYIYLKSPEGFSISAGYNYGEYYGFEISTNKSKYDYEPFLGACTTYGTIFLDLDAKDLVKNTNTTNKPDIELFALKEIDNEYTKKIYNEDYAIAGQKEGMWMYNKITEDDAKPLSYEKFLEYDPVLFTPLPYGKYLMIYNLNFMMVGGCAKPAIYIYSDVDYRDLEVKVIPNGELMSTIPNYDDGWKVQVNRDGSIYNYKDGKKYSYLWWDSYANPFDLPKGGYVIAKSEIDQFLAQKLSEMNLSQQEQQDFLEYLTVEFAEIDSQYFYISFLFNDQVDRIAKLEFSSQPENTFRMFMVYRPVQEFVSIPAPKLEKANREGFLVVEWGGGKI